MDLGKLLTVLRAYRAGAPLGDLVVLKLEAVGAPASIAGKLETVEGYAPATDLAALRQLPPGSLGREYARFLDANGITPLEISPAVRETLRRRPYALRYTLTHDLHHVLAGFDTGLAGEIGVLAFNVGQGAAPIRRTMLWLAGAISALTSPTQARAIAHNLRVGLAMGRAAALVMASPVESWFDQPLADVRHRLGIPEPREAGVLPSGSSLVTRLLLPRPARGGMGS